MTGKANGGRPTLYRPEYCDLVIEHMGKGFSLTGFAGEIGVSRQSIYQWAEDHEAFSDALNIARAKSALWWEKAAINLAITGEGNATTIVFGLKNRVADEWRDKREHDHRSGDGSMTPAPPVAVYQLPENGRDDTD